MQPLHEMRPLIVVGMHRSGTGLLSHILSELGIFMGIDQTRNKESAFFQKINKEALDMIGCNWRCVDFLPETDEMYGSHKWLLRYMQKSVKIGLLKDFFGKNGLAPQWGWKDPRSSILLPFWEQIFPKAKVIHIMRNGRDVAISLIAREFSREDDKTFLSQHITSRFSYYLHLWSFYLDRIADSIDRFDTAITIRYESLLDNPQSEINKIVQSIGLNMDFSKIQNACRDVGKRNENIDVYNHIKQQTLGLELIQLLNRFGY
jgi:hypothetical protein